MHRTNRIQLFTFLAITLNFLPHDVQSHGNGAPSSRCDTMQPGHWVSPQEGMPPYQVIIDKAAVTPGERVNITLRAVRGQTGFKGFFVMVKEGDGDNLEGDEAASQKEKDSTVYGTFDLVRSDINQAQPVHCFSQRDSAMTHVTNEVKDYVELSWIAPSLLPKQKKSHGHGSHPYMEKELKVVATFVKDFWTVWTDVEPIGDVRLLLTDTQQLSPKFQSPQPAPPPRPLEKSSSPIKKGSFDPTEVVLPAPGGSTSVEESSSWSHLKRVWNMMISLFNS